MKECLRFFREEDGVGVVEVILIVVVLIALVAIFKSRLTSLVGTIFDTIDKQAGKI
jgi:Flp pilus assembly pilin Flp